jgi:hypothetical protein
MYDIGLSCSFDDPADSSLLPIRGEGEGGPDQMIVLYDTVGTVYYAYSIDGPKNPHDIVAPSIRQQVCSR